MKVLILIAQILLSPFALLFRANAKPSPNKRVSIILVALVSILLLAVLILIYYNKYIIG
jgi:hypothetical protein